jgi:flagellar basal body-associated protein FliL
MAEDEKERSEAAPDVKRRRFPRLNISRRWLVPVAAVVVGFAAGLAADRLIAKLGPLYAGGTVTIDIGEPAVFHPLPPMIVDLKSGTCRSNHVKLAAIVEIAPNHLEQLQEAQPEIVDAIHDLLRERQRLDLVGEAGADRLRAEILLIVNRKLTPAKADNVLFSELLLD